MATMLILWSNDEEGRARIIAAVRIASDTSIRIVRIITRLNIGGPAIQAIELSARLQPPEYQTLLVHGRLGVAEGDMRHLLPSRRLFEVEHMPTLRRDIDPLADTAATAQIYQLLKRFEPTIVHTHMSKAGAVGRAAALLYNATARQRRRARLVHTYHGQVFDGYFSRATSSAFQTIDRVLGRRTDALIAVSDSVERDLVRRHGIATADRFHVVPLGLDLSDMAAIAPSDRIAARTALDIDPSAPVVAFVGRLTAIKQPLLFVEAARLIASRDDRIVFVVAGSGELENAMLRRSSALGLASRVHFLGWRRDVATVYAASDLLVLTSRNEGTPVALIEAMAAGVPGVCFAVGGVPDVIAGSEMGVLVPEGDITTLADAICELICDEQRRRAMGERARARALDRYRIERLVTDVTALYRRIIQ
jgi:glycosyltransferase involved in cell wall biosynthesis